LFSNLRRVIAAGLAIRLILAPFFAHPFDVFAWYTNSESLLSGARPIWSFLAPYSYSFFLFVFPAGFAFSFLSRYIGSFTIPISSLNPALNPGPQWNITVVPGLLFDLLVKLPLVASDALIAILLYKMVRKQQGDERLAVSVAALWFLNPLTVWVSSGWGMFDTLPALFTVLALYLLLEERLAYAGVSLAFAIAMKYYAVVLVVPLLILSWHEKRGKGLLACSVGLLGAGLLLVAPSFGETASSFASLAGGAFPAGLRYSGLSIWTAVTLFYPSFNQTILSSILVAVALVAIYYWMARNDLGSNGPSSYAFLFGLPLLALLLLFKFAGENYFVWLLPFASIIAVGDSRSRALYWGIILVALLSSVVNSLLPYYMLPIAQWVGGHLVNALSTLAPYRVAPAGVIVQGITIGKVVLAGFGIVTAAVLVTTAFRWFAPYGVLPSFRSLRRLRVLAPASLEAKR